MTRRALADAGLPSAERRLTLTPLGLDVIAALAHDQRGLRLTPLATIIGAPISSTQAALRVLGGHGLVTVVREDVPVYRLAAHPARDSLIDVVLTTTESTHAIATVLRASAAVIVAIVDGQGFVVGLDAAPTAEDQARLDASLARIREVHDDAPRIYVTPADELARMVQVSLGSRDRFAAAVWLKGSLPLLTERRSADRESVRTTAR